VISLCLGKHVARLIVALATGPISGAHLNPAISIAFALLRPCKQFGWIKVLPYSIAQTVGATLFSWINYKMYAPVIAKWEAEEGIIRGAAASVASAKAFGEYFG